MDAMVVTDGPASRESLGKDVWTCEGSCAGSRVRGGDAKRGAMSGIMRDAFSSAVKEGGSEGLLC
jgi:hypothetical protein